MVEKLSSKELISIWSIGFDMDGVLANARVPGVRKYNELRGTSHKVEEAFAYDQVKVWAMEEGMSEEDAHKLNRQIWDDPEVLTEAEPIDGAVELMEFLYQKNIKPPIITTRICNLKDCTFSWFEKSMPFLDLSTIHVGSHENITEGLAHKISSIKKTNVAIFVEDHPETIDKILEETNAIVILVVHGFNKKYAYEQLGNKRILLSTNGQDSEPTVRPILNLLKDNLRG